jgi:hypothetical protein
MVCCLRVPNAERSGRYEQARLLPVCILQVQRLELLREVRQTAATVAEEREAVKQYKVIHQYLSYGLGEPILLPVGTVGEWFEQADAYLFHVGNYAIPVKKWAVEAWTVFFEEVK